MTEKKRNPNFVYKFSDALQQELAISKKTGNVTCADGVKYSYDEIILIGGLLTLAAHRVKKSIGGVIVEFKKNETASSTKTGSHSGNEQLSFFEEPSYELPD